MSQFKVLIINPGSTSTKLAIYREEGSQLETTVRHDPEKINQYDKIADQFDFRKQVILTELQEKGVNLKELDAVSARGGLLKPLPGGTYRITEPMLKDLRLGVGGEHASNLGGLIAYEIAEKYDIPSYIVDPVVVDEMQPVAKVAGHPEFERRSIFHALNQKAVARKVAKELNKDYAELNLVVAHLGGGISIGAHKSGEVIDVNNALNGEGPFSPERSGTLPVGDLVELSYSGEYSLDQIKDMIVGAGGLMAYCGTSDTREIEQMIQEGDEEAEHYYKAMAYQVAKEIGSAAAVLKGKVDAVVLTGGIAHSDRFTSLIKDQVEFIASVKIYPGEDELKALAEGAFRVLQGKEKAKTYSP